MMATRYAGDAYWPDNEERHMPGGVHTEQRVLIESLGLPLQFVLCEYRVPLEVW